jgi:hypothetical protein
MPRSRPLALFVGLALFACGPRVWDSTLVSGDGLSSSTGDDQAYLLAHLESGDVVVFSDWTVPAEGAERLTGNGTRFDPERLPLLSGDVSLPLDSVVLLEANRSETVSAFAMSSLTVWTAISVITSFTCAADPKECFGSCPTFYLEADDDRPFAEGFSSSFARTLEATDVDRVPVRGVGGERVSLVMRNEAPETHAVRTVRLRTVSVAGGGDVGLTPEGRYYEITASAEAETCSSSSLEGSCRDAIRAADGLEYWVPTDSSDLAAPETVQLEFRLPAGAHRNSLALSLRARQSLVSTFLFYQTIAYLGGNAGTWLAALERGDEELTQRSLGLARALGGIEVEVLDGATWVPAGHFDEAGPIAADTWLLPLNPMLSPLLEPLRVRLTMSRGFWRLDEVRLVALGEERPSVPFDPVLVETLAGPHPGDLALARLIDPDRQLTTQRGEAYRIHFDLPVELGEVVLFLESRGYYYEWMRPDWRDEEDASMAGLIFSDPAAALVRMAPLFKERESDMEQAFWSSRFRADRPVGSRTPAGGTR